MGIYIYRCHCCILVYTYMYASTGWRNQTAPGSKRHGVIPRHSWHTLVAIPWAVKETDFSQKRIFSQLQRKYTNIASHGFGDLDVWNS